MEGGTIVFRGTWKSRNQERTFWDFENRFENQGEAGTINELEKLLSELERIDAYKQIAREWRQLLHELEKKGMLRDD